MGILEQLCPEPFGPLTFSKGATQRLALRAEPHIAKAIEFA
jgi:hypothetical protein